MVLKYMYSKYHIIHQLVIFLLLDRGNVIAFGAIMMLRLILALIHLPLGIRARGCLSLRMGVGFKWLIPLISLQGPSLAPAGSRIPVILLLRTKQMLSSVRLTLVRSRRNPLTTSLLKYIKMENKYHMLKALLLDT